MGIERKDQGWDSDSRSNMPRDLTSLRQLQVIEVSRRARTYNIYPYPSPDPYQTRPSVLASGLPSTLSIDRHLDSPNSKLKLN